jgi:HPt (histidine-containing phosphotransfer) domain-containing protein
MVNMAQVIDLGYLESISDGDNTLVIELVNIFLDQIEEFTKGFKENFENKNWKNISALAHKAKSSVNSMGINELGDKNLKNLELISKFLSIQELENKENKDEKEIHELEALRKVLSGFPEDRQIWIKENANTEMVASIIDNFNNVCKQAKVDIEIFLNKN